MKKEIKIDIAKSKSSHLQNENEFEEFLQTKRKNNILKDIDISFSENKNQKK